jgi:S-adenosylmethionine hydrolase
VRSGILTLTTDFGADGHYVAQMKGIVLGLAPGTQIVDLCHAIPPQDIAMASYMLGEVVQSFPRGTVHLAVIDPGVGTDRRLIVVEACEQWFVLPDNGLIGGVLRSFDPAGTWEIRNPELRRSEVSSTFHGRDILAPVAAHLLRGGDPSDVGPKIDYPSVPGLTPRPGFLDGSLDGEVVFIDWFGNLITDVFRRWFGRDDPRDWEVEILGQTIPAISRTYGEHPPGTLLALIGSTRRLEIAVVNGDAAKQLGAGCGTTVSLRRVGETET